MEPVTSPAKTKTKPRKKPAAKKPSKVKAKAPVRSARVVAAKKACILITKALDKNKAEDISVLDLTGKSSFADYMIVASGRSQRQVAALADYVVKAVRGAHLPLLSVEGKEVADWVLIDAGDVVVHIFRPEVREFYNLEKMWAIPFAPTR